MDANGWSIANLVPSTRRSGVVVQRPYGVVDGFDCCGQRGYGVGILEFSVDRDLRVVSGLRMKGGDSSQKVEHAIVIRLATRLLAHHAPLIR